MLVCGAAGSERAGLAEHLPMLDKAKTRRTWRAPRVWRESKWPRVRHVEVLFSLTSQIMARVGRRSFVLRRFPRPPEPSAGSRGRASVSARARGKGEARARSTRGGRPDRRCVSRGPRHRHRGTRARSVRVGTSGARRARRGDAPGARARPLRGAGPLRRACWSARAQSCASPPRAAAPRPRGPRPRRGRTTRSLVRSRASRFDAPFTEAMRAAAAAEVRRMFHHGTQLPEARVPHDELKPLTKTYTDSLGELELRRSTRVRATAASRSR